MMAKTGLLVATAAVLPGSYALYPDALIWNSDCPDDYDFCGGLEFCEFENDNYEQFFGYRLENEAQADCTYPGPLIRLKPGNKYKFTLRNTGVQYRSTNIHTHGLHIVGDGDSDDMTRVVSGGNCLDYTWDLLPDHPGGTYWYHAHHHGYTLSQVSGGAFGMLIVDDNEILNPDIPSWASNEILLQISYINGIVRGNGKHSTDHIEVLEVPKANTWYRLRLSIVDPYAQPENLVFHEDAALVGGNSCDVHKVASDGIWRSTVPGPKQTTFELTGASRADFAIRCATEFTFYNISYADQVAATLQVGSLDLSPAFDELPEWIPNRPASLSNIADATVPLGNNLTLWMNFEGINDEPWNPIFPLASIAYDQVHEWTLENTARHPFHLHLYHMMIATPGGCGSHEEGEFYDTISLNVSGPCTVRFKAADFGQRCVLHCHVLEHEDSGSMGWVDVRGQNMKENNAISPQYACSSLPTFSPSASPTVIPTDFPTSLPTLKPTLELQDSDDDKKTSDLTSTGIHWGATTQWIRHFALFSLALVVF